MTSCRAKLYRTDFDLLLAPPPADPGCENVVAEGAGGTLPPSQGVVYLLVGSACQSVLGKMGQTGSRGEWRERSRSLLSPLVCENGWRCCLINRDRKMPTDYIRNGVLYVTEK